jgi:hypothetical protein
MVFCRSSRSEVCSGTSVAAAIKASFSDGKQMQLRRVRRFKHAAAQGGCVHTVLLRNYAIDRSAAFDMYDVSSLQDAIAPARAVFFLFA